MLFLKMPDWLSKIADSEIMGTVIAGFRTLMFSLCSYVYGLIINLYELFEVLCTARILDSGVLEEMSKRIGIILGLITLFYVVFSFVKMLIDPDKISDKEAGAGAIIKKVILVIILLGVSNFGFKLLYKIQVLIMENHVVSRLILPYQPEDEDMDKFGNYLSEQLFLSFYHVENFDTSELASSDGENNLMLCSQVVDSFRLQIRNHGRFELGYTCLNESVPINVVSETTGAVEQDETFVINFNVVLAPVAGIAVAYLLLMYCFSVGVRMVQLAFLEVIAPIAIVGYLAPKKENMLTKWAGIYFSTYIDAFIRIAIINFVVFIIFVIFSSGSDLFEANTFWLSVGDPQDFKTRSIFTVVVIISLLTFAKKAPDLLKEIMPSTGKAKLGFGAKMKDFVGLKAGFGGFVGATAGAAVGLIGGRGIGAIGGAFRGAKAGLGAKGVGKALTGGWQAQSKINKTNADIRANGGSWFGHQMANLQKGLGMRTGYESDENYISKLQEKVDMYNTASKEAEGEATKNGSHYAMMSFDGNNRTLTQLEHLASDQSQSATRRAQYAQEYKDLLKASTMFNLDYGMASEKGVAYFDSSGSFTNLDYAGNSYNSDDIDSMSLVDRKGILGDSNATIDANMSKLVGSAKSGRGKNGKSVRNANNTKITQVKLSDKYRKNKANSGK